jgi:hypothetical protein
MKVLKVVSRKTRGGAPQWFITGLTGREDIPLDYRLPYPETEWPEIGSIEGKKSMHRALYDAWQTSDELEREDEQHGRDGLVFKTPYGDFATYSFEVVPAEEMVRIANRLLRRQETTSDKLYTMVMSKAGFGPQRMEQIRRQYGGRFEDWPADLRRKYWAAERKAHAAMHIGQRREPSSGAMRSAPRRRSRPSGRSRPARRSR